MLDGLPGDRTSTTVLLQNRPPNLCTLLRAAAIACRHELPTLPSPLYLSLLGLRNKPSTPLPPRVALTALGRGPGVTWYHTAGVSRDLRGMTRRSDWGAKVTMLQKTCPSRVRQGKLEPKWCHHQRRSAPSSTLSKTREEVRLAVPEVHWDNCFPRTAKDWNVVQTGSENISSQIHAVGFTTRSF